MNNLEHNLEHNLNPPFDKGILTLGGCVNVVLDSVPSHVLQDLKPIIYSSRSSKSSSKQINNYLAGAIDIELQIDPPSSLNKYLYSLFHTYIEFTPDFLSPITQLFFSSPKNNTNTQNIDLLEIVTDEVWINFQKKHEYNPIHNHAGILSWVIWYDIPYNINEELLLGPGNKDYDSENKIPNGKFGFVFNKGGENGGVNDLNLPIDYKWNGTIAMFPSNLYHQVYPFYTSDKERITLAGNLLLNINK